MLSVFIDCGPEDHWLAATLAPLVPGAVEGLVREVVLVDRGMGDARKVSDHAGCRVEPAEAFHAVVQAAQGDWLLLLEPGARLQPGWMPAVIEHAETVAAGSRRRSRGTVRAGARRPAQRLSAVAADPHGDGRGPPPAQAPGDRAVAAGDEPRGAGQGDRGRPDGGRYPPGQAALNAAFPTATGPGPRRGVASLRRSGRRACRCSSSRGMISTKLQGRWR